MINFDNTEIAFAGKSDKELKRAYRLFKLLSYPLLVKVGKFLTFFAFRIHLPIQSLVKKTIFAQFCGGETIEESRKKIEQLGQFNIGTILDYSVEGQDDEKSLDYTCQEICATAKIANNNPNVPFCVFKVTGVSRFALLEKVSSGKELSVEEKQEYLRVVNRVDTICKSAYEANTSVFIDAEESWIQKAIDDLAEAMMAKYNKNKSIVYNTAQMYRHDRLQYINELHTRSQKANYFLGIKLVRGAYMEKERKRAIELNYTDPIQPNKEACDNDYNAALAYCITNSKNISICIATHNEMSSQLGASLMQEHALNNDAPQVSFAQLLGMSDHISYNLADKNYRVAKYVPYGPVREVLPYLMRRAEENTSVKGQTGRELSLILKERARRKAAK